MKNKFLLFFLSTLSLLLLPAWSAAETDGADSAPANHAGGQRLEKPNVILVLADDQGYGDMSCLNNPMLKTPAMDALFRQSVRLTDFHVDPCCSPTRAALMTGRYSSRVGVWHTVLGRSLLRASETTMADVFAANGYRTGIFGKWHLGDSYPFRPQDRGFQEVLCFRGGGIGNSPDYWGNHYFDDTYFRDNTTEKFTGYCTDIWFNEALKFISANRDHPFFCYLPLNAPHAPLRVPEKYAQPYQGKVSPQRAKYYGMIACIDEDLGRFRQALRQMGLEKNTIFIYSSDNGTEDGADFDDQGNVIGGYNAGMRGAKLSEYDGGHRDPCLIYWPAGGLAGGRDVNHITADFDLLPTLIGLCRLTPPKHEKFDGTDLSPLLRNSGEAAVHWPDRILCVHNQRVINPIKGKNYSVMTDRWRWVNGRELYEIKLDPGQRTNVAEQHPQVMAKLENFYNQWWNDISVDFDKPARMILGSDQANPTSLNPHDWIGEPHELFDQTQIRRGRERNGLEYKGHWMVQVAQDGRYEIEFRRWPRELNQKITAGLPGETPWWSTGSALPATAATLRIEGQEQTRPVTADMTQVTFTVDLKAGPATLEGRFVDEKSGEERGPFYVYIQRIN